MQVNMGKEWRRKKHERVSLKLLYILTALTYIIASKYLKVFLRKHKTGQKNLQADAFQII